ncbi:hypothetical protein M3Y98_01080100 [Aphelenchoides besseyi]|nr:hypothetical protein M3Y98_01080100 [Aphelenchoides besseyi]
MAENVSTILRDIIKFLDEKLPDLKVTRAVLEKPTFDAVKKIYMALLLYCGVVTEQQLYLDSQSTVHEQRICGKQTMVLDQLMKHFTQNVCHNDTWTIRDLSCPESKRTIIFVNELIQFFYFVNDREKELEELFEEKKRLQIDQLQDKKLSEQLQRSIKNKKNELEKFRHSKMEHSQQRDVDRKNAADKRTYFEQLQQQMIAHNSRFEETSQARSSIHEQYDEREEAIRQLQDRLVRSPDRLRKEIETFDAQNTQRTTTMNSFENSLSDLQRKIHALKQTASHTLQTIKTEYEEVLKDIKLLEEDKIRQNQRQFKIDTAKSTKTKLEQKKKEALENHQNELEKMSKKETHQEKCASANVNFDKLNADIIANHSAIEEKKRQLQNCPTTHTQNLILQKKQEMSSLVFQLQDINANIVNEVKSLEDRLIEVYESWKDMNNKISGAMKKYSETFL